MFPLGASKNELHLVYTGWKRKRSQELGNKRNCPHGPCSHGGIVPFEPGIPKTKKTKL